MPRGTMRGSAAWGSVGSGLVPGASSVPTNARGESFSREGASFMNIAGVLTSGRLQMVAVQYNVGRVVSNIAFFSGTSALAVGTNQWFGLFNSSLSRLALTADDTSTAWAADTEKILALTAPFTIPSSGLYYHGVMVAATSVPSLTGAAISSTGVVLVKAPLLHASSTTGLTTPASCPATAGALTVANGQPYTYST